MNQRVNYLVTKPEFRQGFDGERTIHWHSPSNIALVKYWGKYGDQLPQNPSLSFSLKNSYTELKLNYRLLDSRDGPEVDLKFEGEDHPAFRERINTYLKKISDILPFIKQLHFSIETSNTFPHSAGIASSASGMSAVALALCSIENDHFNTLENQRDFFRKASYLARLGSGSAARSVYGGYAIWGEVPGMPAFSNEYALPFGDGVQPPFNDLCDTILIVNSQPKAVSSTLGHKLMIDHPYAEQRFDQARKNLNALIKALHNGDKEAFIRITENEAMQLHAMMMTSDPAYILLDPQSVAIIQKIKTFRQQNGKMLCYTVDAGPNVHLLYPAEIQGLVIDFIKKELEPHCENRKWIDDRIGSGPVRMK